MNKHTPSSKKRQIRVRSKMTGTAVKPRLSVHRSSQHIYAQLIDDIKAVSLVSANSLQLTDKPKEKIAVAKQVGELIAQKALKKKITKVVFDRGSYQYHGRVKALAEGARSKGLKF